MFSRDDLQASSGGECWPLQRNLQTAQEILGNQADHQDATRKLDIKNTVLSKNKYNIVYTLNIELPSIKNVPKC